MADALLKNRYRFNLRKVVQRFQLGIALEQDPLPEEVR